MMIWIESMRTEEDFENGYDFETRVSEHDVRGLTNRPPDFV